MLVYSFFQTVGGRRKKEADCHLDAMNIGVFSDCSGAIADTEKTGDHSSAFPVKSEPLIAGSFNLKSSRISIEVH